MSKPLAIRGAGALILLIFAWLLPAGSAQAAFGVVNPVAQPASTQAGANTDFEASFDVSEPDKQLRDVTVELPPGLVGNPQAVPKCAVAAFNADTCAPASEVGTTTVSLTLIFAPPFAAPFPINGTIYNLEPNPGEPGRLGIKLNSPLPGIVPNIHSQAAVELREDYGLSTILEGLPNAILGISIFITSVELALDETFISNPTSCDTAITRLKIRSYAAPGAPPATGQDSFVPTGCAQQPYDPKVSVVVGDGGTLSPAAPPPVTSTIEQAPGEANTRRVELVLPAGLGSNSELILAGDFCAPASFEAGTCAASHQVGDALAESPLLPAPLTGPVYLVSSGGLLPRIGLDLRGVLNLKLFGDSTIVAGGRLGTTFDGLPDLPLPRFGLSFDGGPGGLFTVGDELCKGTGGFQASFLSQGDRALTATGTAKLRSCPPIVQGETAKKKCEAKAKKAKKGKRCKKKKRKKK